MINLLDLDAAGLAALFADLGEKPFRAKQVSRWVHQRLVDGVDAMTDLSRTVRAPAGGNRGDPRPGGDQRHDGAGRHAQVAARRGRRQRRRGGLHSRGRPRHAVHLVAGGLRARLRVLLDRQAGLQSQSHDGRDRRPALAREPRAAAPTASRAPWVEHGRAPITNVVMMGMGEPLANYDNVVPALRADARRQRVRTVAPPRDAVDVRARAARSIGCATIARSRSPSRCTRRQRRCATASCRSTASIRSRELLAACVRYLDRAPRDFVTFEYVMLDGVNDSAEQARELARARARRAVQVQPDSVESASRRRLQRRVRARGSWRSRERCIDAGFVDDDPQDPRRGHRRRVRPACGPSAGPNQAADPAATSAAGTAAH